MKFDIQQVFLPSENNNLKIKYFGSETERQVMKHKQTNLYHNFAVITDKFDIISSNLLHEQQHNTYTTYFYNKIIKLEYYSRIV